MIRKFLILSILCISPFWLFAQQPKAVLVATITQQQLDYGGSVKKIMKKNNVSPDSLIAYLNNKTGLWMEHVMTGTKVMMMDTALLRFINDSSETEEMFTSSHLQKIEEAQGFKKLQRYNENENSIRFYGRHFNQSAKEAMLKEVSGSGIDYLIVLNRIVLSGSSKSGFAVHYEIFDSQLNRVYGDKYYHFFSTSNSMYFSTLLYYLDYSLEGFSKKLSTKFPELKRP